MISSKHVARLLAGLGALLAWAAAGAEPVAAVVRTPQVRAELVAHAPEGVAAGKPLWLGLKIEHQPNWHTYWKNPGDSGLPTTLAWTLPAGVTAGPIEWPTPRRLPIGPLLNYGYEGTVLLPVALQVPAGFAAETLPVKLHAEWLVCKDVCIPEGGDFALDLPARAATAAQAALFEAARAALPGSDAGVQASAEVQGDALVVRVAGLPAAWTGRSLAFFPETPGVLHNAARPEARWSGSEWTARLALDPQRTEAPATLPAVLAADGQPAGLGTTVAVKGPWPPLPAAQAAASAPAAEARSATEAAPPAGGADAERARAAPIGLGLALVLALGGGMLLNLMPCVFPVLAIKVLGFARHGDDRRAHRISGLAYSTGVVLSFVALGALMLALRAAGEQLGWGFQLQSPLVVALLGTLFAVLGLNLAGVFEFGRFLPSGVATLQARHPVVDAGLSGVLAVAVASPCTAPFMGASLGLAVGLPAAQALALFAALGLGMALPYLAASWLPAVARALPRPGAWMDVFKKFMAFPMFGTAVWLLWVLGQQSGIDGAGALLALWVALALLLWALGLAGRARWVIASLALAFTAFLAQAIGPNVLRGADSAADPAAAPAQAAAAGERWQPWSPARVQALLGEGRPVFVDFTAAWCVTCQYNKKTTLASAEVLAAMDAARVQTLRADWTRRDAVISAELQRLGRSGVPVYVLLAPGQAPVVFSEVLSAADVKGALAALKS